MELTPQEQQRLDEDREILELKDNRAWQLFRRTRIEDAIKRIEDSLANKKQTSWEAYLSLWERKVALQSLLGELDTAIEREIETLEKKLESEPDNRPATGALA